MLDEGDEKVSPSANERKTILVVEDEELVRMAVLDELQERGLEALEARHAMAALSILESDRPVDLVIADIGLPGLDGTRLVSMARELRPELKVLFLTGYPIDPGTEVPPRTKFVEKPVDLNVLAMMAQEMLREA